ncbi:hypothetical protein JZX87_23985 [Agrobacterium sp. Ap1]|uniref:hypothetical protein n=1 Tax=Agrobacterium sp. Ap1 TaxID=2815337 RepID=UPI001A8D7C97|nr:hypothetical protein [Agrobacterium sp. Ap1]MBO0144220.1 hypothetical protein [Agrobacterium sp. Ap1]
MSSSYDGPLTSVLRLFLSVDLVGSTAFKQANQRAFKSEDSKEAIVGEPWFSPIAQFYREIERLFAREWQSYVDGLAKRISWPTGAAPELWKSAGDELLYVKILTDHREAAACVLCWKKTVEEYREQLQRQYPSLDLKCTAWIAGFPITNTEVVFSKTVASGEVRDDDDPLYVNLDLLHRYHRNPKDPNLTKDFIGPSVDTGFRLCALSSPRRFIMSVDLALMIVHALRARPAGADEVNVVLHYHGRVPLKGVLGGKAYPVFWIDMAVDSSLDKLEDSLLEVTPRNTDDIKMFCEEFFRTHASNAIIPYIAGNAEPYFSSVPPSHSEKIERLRNYWIKESERRDLENQSLGSVVDGQDGDQDKVEVLRESISKVLSDNSQKEEKIENG